MKTNLYIKICLAWVVVSQPSMCPHLKIMMNWDHWSGIGFWSAGNNRPMLITRWQYQTNADNKLLHGSNLLCQSHKAVRLDCPQQCLQPHSRQYCTENAAKFHFVNFRQVRYTGWTDDKLPSIFELRGLQFTLIFLDRSLPLCSSNAEFFIDGSLPH